MSYHCSPAFPRKRNFIGRCGVGKNHFPPWLPDWDCCYYSNWRVARQKCTKISLPIGLLDCGEQHESFPRLTSRSCIYVSSFGICFEIMNIGLLSPEKEIEKITPLWLPNLLCKCAYHYYFVPPWCFIKHLFSQTHWSIKCL